MDFERALHNGVIVRGNFKDVIAFGAAFQRHCSTLDIPKAVSLAMFIIGLAFRSHYYDSDQQAIDDANPGFARLGGVKEIQL